MLQPFQEGDISVRVPRSTTQLNISAAFGSSTIAEKGVRYILGTKDMWWSIGETQIFLKEHKLGFTHDYKVVGDILVTSLVGDINQSSSKRFLLQTSANTKPNMKTKDIVFTIEEGEAEEHSAGDSKPVEILGDHIKGNWPAESESDMIRAVCKATNLAMTEIMKWTLDGDEFPYTTKHTKFTQTTSTTADSDDALYRVEQEIIIEPRTHFNGKYLKCEVKDTEMFSTVQVFVNLKIGNPGNVEQMDVLQGQNKISWQLAGPNRLETKCTFNGKEIEPPSNGICSKSYDFSSNETIRPGMKAHLCSADIEGTRTTSINVLTAPTITMRINNHGMKNGGKGSFEEGDQLKLRCDANGGVPKDVRNYTWTRGGEKLGDNSAEIEYTAKRSHNNMDLRCSVDHRAFDDDIYNNTFIKPAVKFILFSFA